MKRNCIHPSFHPSICPSIRPFSRNLGYICPDKMTDYKRVLSSWQQFDEESSNSVCPGFSLSLHLILTHLTSSFCDDFHLSLSSSVSPYNTADALDQLQPTKEEEAIPPN